MSYNPLPSISNFYWNFVKATNEIHTNVWAFLVLILGVAVHGLYGDIGRDLLIGGFALFKTSSSPAQPIPVQDVPKG